ncbi:MAG: hypothetical protein WCK35_19270 [Chloroflexota bacterium]
MITQAVDTQLFHHRAQQIRTRLPILLSQWGLLSRFKRWRLVRDSNTGMVILFGVLNNNYIATHSITPFSNYFDPRLLRDLETELKVRVLPSTNDGLRYAFVLKHGLLDRTVHIEDDRETGTLNSAHFTHKKNWVIERQTTLDEPNNYILMNNLVLMHQKLKNFSNTSQILDGTENPFKQLNTEFFLQDETDFNVKMADYENERNPNPA